MFVFGAFFAAGALVEARQHAMDDFSFTHYFYPHINGKRTKNKNGRQPQNLKLKTTLI